jgi:hypothetical protein
MTAPKNPSNKVPDDIACCGLGSNCVHTHKHMNKFLLIYMKEGKVQESNFYHDCCCNAPPMASTHPHQFDYFCYVLLESLNIIVVVEICWKLNTHQLVVALRRNCPWSPTYKMSSRKNGKASVVNGTGASTKWRYLCAPNIGWYQWTQIIGLRFIPFVILVNDLSV